MASRGSAREILTGVQEDSHEDLPCIHQQLCYESHEGYFFDTTEKKVIALARAVIKARGGYDPIDLIDVVEIDFELRQV